MQNVSKEAYVFGLDIGTRSIVGTVGYRDKDNFYVVAQAQKEHETRSMLDGQIHDIGQVSQTIREVKEILEEKINRKLKDVCIAAAGRVLRTEYASASIEFEEDTEVTEAILYELDSAGVEKAYEIFQKQNDSNDRYYCVGHSVIKYTLNGHPILNLINHKAKSIGMELIATFLPYEVVEGLYKAVELADLEVANLTLEPIAAIEVAIPEKFRMLNIALVDVGAGTSDICITKEGSISAYGMIPIAGDSLTEAVATHCLTEFAEAEKVKRGIASNDVVEYEDIMGLTQSISKEEVLDLLEPSIDSMTSQVCDCIMSLNGDKPVSAIFVVGGGGRIEGYTQKLAEKMGIQVQRVALRGEDVMNKIVFMDDTLTRDSMLVTPLGICLNFYEQNNNFIYVQFNDDRLKLYDNGKLTIVDAVMQSGISNDALFPKRGKALTFTLNGKEKVIKGELGETANIAINGEVADLHASIHPNDIIRMENSTAGKDAKMVLSKLVESKDEIEIVVDGINVKFPRITTVNGEIVSENYEILDGDIIEVQDYYTVSQVMTFLDMINDARTEIWVNNSKASDDTKVYNKFSFEIKKAEEDIVPESYADLKEDDGSYLENKKVMEEKQAEVQSQVQDLNTNSGMETVEALDGNNNENVASNTNNDSGIEETQTTTIQSMESNIPIEIGVIVNNSPVFLKGKSNYVFVDVFDYINFDLSKPQGSGIVTNLNGKQAQYMEEIKAGDVLEIYWKE